MGRITRNVPLDDRFDGSSYPYKEKAMMYVDLERDFIVTAHRDEMDDFKPGNFLHNDPRFNLPVTNSTFNILSFRRYFPRRILIRIRNLVITSKSDPVKIFRIRRERNATTKVVYVVKDAFWQRDGAAFGYRGRPPLSKIDSADEFGVNCEKDFINQFHKYRGPIPGRDLARFGGKVKRPYRIDFLESGMRDGTLANLWESLWPYLQDKMC